jgi:hypothetical protein
MVGMWRTENARTIATEHLSGLGRRWAHAQMVGTVADALVGEGTLSADVAAAAWLHDVGYAPALVTTGLHPLDGAAYLAREGAPDDLVGLVAHHTGAVFEAEERGLSDELAALPRPDPEALDALTLIDLVVGPDGALTSPEARVAEILTRYGPDHPVHRAVTRSRPALLAMAARARSRLGLSDVWPVGAVESVGQA